MEIISVVASSLDGSLASYPNEPDEERQRYGFLNEADRTHLLGLLADADAVILGAASLRASGAGIARLQSARAKSQTEQIWAVLSRSGAVGDEFWRLPKLQKWLVGPTPQPVPKDCGAKALTYGKEHPATFLARQLQESAVEKALLFGGAQINRLFYEKQLVHSVVVTICPVIFASNRSVPMVAPELEHPVNLTLSEVTHASHLADTSNNTSKFAGNLVFLKYKVNPT